MSPARAAFSWVPKVDLYPLFTVCGVAIGVLGYCSYRAIAHNPDVHLTKAHKQDGAAESGITLERAQLYYHSIFRKAKAMRTDGDKVDTRIFQ